MSASEIREAVSAHKLIKPMTAVRSAVRITHAEPLRSQLCRVRDGLQYELTLLRRDGKIVRVTMNAANGALIAAKSPTERGKPSERPKIAVDRMKQAPGSRKQPTGVRMPPVPPNRPTSAAAGPPGSVAPFRSVLDPLEHLLAPEGRDGAAERPADGSGERPKDKR